METEKIDKTTRAKLEEERFKAFFFIHRFYGKEDREALLSSPTFIQIPTRSDQDPLEWAVSSPKRIEGLNALLKGQKDIDKIINKEYKNGNKLIHLAVRAKNVPGVKALLPYQNDVNVQNNLGETPLYQLIEANNPLRGLKKPSSVENEIYDLLAQSGAAYKYISKVSGGEVSLIPRGTVNVADREDNLELLSHSLSIAFPAVTSAISFSIIQDDSPRISSSYLSVMSLMILIADISRFSMSCLDPFEPAYLRNRRTSEKLLNWAQVAVPFASTAATVYFTYSCFKQSRS